MQKLPKKQWTGKPISQRQLRVGEHIRHLLSAIFVRREFDESILNKAHLSVARVYLTPDLQHATAYVMPLGRADMDKIIPLLALYTPHLRAKISKGLSMKYTPTLTFKADMGLDEGYAIDALLNAPRVRRDLGRIDEPS